MELPATAALAGRLIRLDESASTNAHLVALAADPAVPDRTVVVTDVQTAGRGRLGRAWWAPPGTSLAISLLLRPRVPSNALPWIPLLAGAAMTASLRRQGAAADLKWPNDVLIGGRKVSGILAEALPDGAGVVVGAGLNHRIPADALPVPTATSLAVEGGPTDADALIAGWLAAVDELRAPFEAADGDADASGLRAAVTRLLGTIGRRVRVEPPAGDVFEGLAVDLDSSGALVVHGFAGRRTIAAGDVTHLRYE